MGKYAEAYTFLEEALLANPNNKEVDKAFYHMVTNNKEIENRFNAKYDILEKLLKEYMSLNKEFVNFINNHYA